MELIGNGVAGFLAVGGADRLSRDLAVLLRLRDIVTDYGGTLMVANARIELPSGEEPEDGTAPSAAKLAPELSVELADWAEEISSLAHTVAAAIANEFPAQ